MGEYGDLTDQERRKLYRDFSEAAKEIKVDGTRPKGSKPEDASLGGRRPA